MFNFKIVGATQEYNHIESEENAANIIIDNLGVDKSLFKYTKPCKDYSTIIYKDYDLFRIKYTDNAKWIRIPMSTDMRKANINNSLFDAEKNKNKVFWKSNINDLNDYKNILLEVINFRDK